MDCKRGYDLSDFDKGRIYALRFHANYEIRETSESLEISENTIKKYLQRTAITGEVDHNNRQNCKGHRCTTEEEDERMANLCKANPYASRNEIKLLSNATCSNSTLTRRFRESGIKSYRPASKCELKEHHKIARLEWAKERIGFTWRHWENVAFSDESRFCLGQQSVQFVRQRGIHYHSSKSFCSPCNGLRCVFKMIVYQFYSCRN